MNRTETCYQKEKHMVTLHYPVKFGQPMTCPMKVRMQNGEEKTISRREYKAWRKQRKAGR